MNTAAMVRADRVATVREAARQRQSIGGADAQALEHALTVAEREIEAADLSLASMLQAISARDVEIERLRAVLRATEKGGADV